MKKLLSIITLLSGLFASNNILAQTIKEDKTTENKKILVAYYSHSGNTKEVAKAIHKQVGGDIFEIKTETTYPDEYKPMTEQAKTEIETGFHPKLTTHVENINQYDVIFLGSPNWWGTITPAVSSFIASYDLSGKKIIPFISNGGGGVQRTISDMTEQCKNCDVEQNGWVGYGSIKIGLNRWLKKIGFSD